MIILDHVSSKPTDIDPLQYAKAEEIDPTVNNKHEHRIHKPTRNLNPNQVAVGDKVVFMGSVGLSLISDCGRVLKMGITKEINKNVLRQQQEPDVLNCLDKVFWAGNN